MSRRASESQSRQPQESANWPEGYAPAGASVYACNELAIPTSPDRIWEWLVRAHQWPHWYPNSWSVKILRKRHRGSGKKLGSGSVFKWITFGLPITAEVDLFDEPTMIGWKWHSRGWSGAAWGYHMWSIESQPHGCLVITQETQRGPLPRLLRFILQPAVHFAHGLWLRRLSQNAIRGRPR